MTKTRTCSFNIGIWCSNAAFSLLAISVIRHHRPRRVSSFAICGFIGGTDGITSGIGCCCWVVVMVCRDERGCMSRVANILGARSRMQYVTDHERGVRRLWGSCLRRFRTRGARDGRRELGCRLCIGDTLPGGRWGWRGVHFVNAARRILRARRGAGRVLLAFLAFLLRVHDFYSRSNSKRDDMQVGDREENHRSRWMESSRWSK